VAQLLAGVADRAGRPRRRVLWNLVPAAGFLVIGLAFASAGLFYVFTEDPIDHWAWDISFTDGAGYVVLGAFALGGWWAWLRRHKALATACYVLGMLGLLVWQLPAAFVFGFGFGDANANTGYSVNNLVFVVVAGVSWLSAWFLGVRLLISAFRASGAAHPGEPGWTRPTTT
jgi:hypothetical protein